MLASNPPRNNRWRAAPGPSIRLSPLLVFRIEGQSIPTVAPFTRLSLFLVLPREGQS